MDSSIEDVSHGAIRVWFERQREVDVGCHRLQSIERCRLRQCSRMHPERGMALAALLAKLEEVTLAEELAAQLNRVVSDDVALAADAYGSITIIAGAKRKGHVIVYQDQPPDGFGYIVLKNLQDQIIECTTGGRAWPHSDEYVARHELPEPHAEIVDGVLRCWYGERDAPVLELPPITLVSESSPEAAFRNDA